MKKNIVIAEKNEDVFDEAISNCPGFDEWSHKEVKNFCFQQHKEHTGVHWGGKDFNLFCVWPAMFDA